MEKILQVRNLSLGPSLLKKSNIEYQRTRIDVSGGECIMKNIVSNKSPFVTENCDSLQGSLI